MFSRLHTLIVARQVNTKLAEIEYNVLELHLECLLNKSCFNSIRDPRYLCGTSRIYGLPGNDYPRQGDKHPQTGADAQCAGSTDLRE